MRPKPQARIGDEEYLFSINLVYAETKLARVVALEHRVQISITEADALHLFLAEMAGAPGDFEASFRGAVNQVRSRAQVVGQIGIGFHRLESRRRAVIAVFANQCVDGLVFAEFLDGWSENNQLGAVGQRHAGAIDRFVAKPCGVEFFGIKIDDGLLDRLVEHFEIYFKAQLRGLREALDIIAYVQAAHRQPAVGSAAHHRLHINDGQMFQEMIGGVIEHVAHRIGGAAHDPLHPVDGAQVVAAIDAVTASRAYQNVLVVVGHADHFMRHNLANGENQVEAAPRDQLVDLRRPRITQLTFRLFADEIGRYLAKSLDVRAPIMHLEKIQRHIAVHRRDLLGLHRRTDIET